MDTRAVHDAVAKLREALAQPDEELTSEIRSELELALRDVERALRTRRESSLNERVGELATRFEVTHPALAESVASLARALAAIGI
jgi:hypothetical protein